MILREKYQGGFRPYSRILGFLTIIAGVASTAIAVFIPTVYFTFAINHQRSSLEIETAYVAKNIEKNIMSRPEMWEFETLRLTEIMSHPTVKGMLEERQIRLLNGQILVETSYKAPAPTIFYEAPIHDSGRIVGYLEAQRSIRLIITYTFLASIIGVVSGWSAFYVFREYPLRFLQIAFDSLSEEKAKSDATLQSIADGVVVLDPEDRVVMANRTALAKLGLRPEEIAGKPLREVYQARNLTDDEFTPGKVDNKRLLTSMTGERYLIEEVFTPLETGSEGSRSGSVLVFRDITELTRVEEELMRTRQMDSLGILAGGIAHDFNNFLTAILGNLSLAQIYCQGNEKAIKRLDEAEKATERAKQLATKFLTFAKGGKPVRKAVDIAAIVREATELAVGGTGVQVFFEIPETEFRASADPHQIAQVINNLALNAVQALGGKGSIEVSIQNRSVREGEIPHLKAGSYILIKVRDSGPGIPQELLSRIFEPYFTTKQTGSGIGLATCYNVMKKHGGNVFAESPPSGGAVFLVYLPATEEPPQSESRMNQDKSVRGVGLVLVMDDDDSIREVIAEMLRALGYDAQLTTRGEEALEAYRKALDAGRVVDAVILDLTVPGGMGGKDTAAEILKLDPAARLIVSSGYSNDPVVSHPKKFGFKGVVAKPYRMSELSKTLSEVIPPKPSA